MSATPQSIDAATATLPTWLVAAVAEEIATVLTPTERRVLHLRFGIGEPACSLAITARRLGVRPSHVLRIERRALRRLRAAAEGAPMQ